jgi:hypothetical protein
VTVRRTDPDTSVKAAGLADIAGQQRAVADGLVHARNGIAQGAVADRMVREALELHPGADVFLIRERAHRRLPELEERGLAERRTDEEGRVISRPYRHLGGTVRAQAVCWPTPKLLEQHKSAA